MSNYTPNNLQANIESCLELHSLTIDTDMDHSDIVDMVREQIDMNKDSLADVTYYHEAFEIVGGCDWNEYEAEDLDFSQCDSALQALMQEANSIVAVAFSDLACTVADEVAGEIMHFIEAAIEEGYDGSISLMSSTCHGWAVHAKEDLEGVCFYYNLEGEQGLTALEYQVASGVYASVCWNK